MGSPGNSTFTWQHALTLHSSLSPFDSPFPTTHPAFKDAPTTISWVRINISGVLLTIYGLAELSSGLENVSILWLLHGRGDTQDSMSFVASSLLTTYNTTFSPRLPPKGLLCITLDHRNHGSRMIDNLANVSWKQGNPSHAKDMFNTYSGTAADVSQLIDHLPGYLPSHLRVVEHLVGGLSLGAHAAWQVVLNEPRVRGAIVIVGCPDYVRLMTDRAIRSGVQSAVQSDPPGKHFLGSRDFPRSLVEVVERVDPAGVLLGELDTVTGDEWRHEPDEGEKRRLRPILEQRLGGKRIVCVSGGKDKLVPHEMGKPLMTWLQAATEREMGWAKELDIEVVDYVDENARHECTVKMRKVIERWLIAYMLGHDMPLEKDSKL